jgi:penicillin-binding protein 1A
MKRAAAKGPGPSSGAVTRSASSRSLRRFVLRMFLFTALLVISVAGAVAVVVYRDVTRDLPDLRQLSRYRPPIVSEVYAASGERIAELYFERRRVVPLDDIPVVVRQAFLAAEDSAFYAHHGIDFPGIARAFLTNLSAGEVTQGGSTITQQVVKALLLTPRKSYERKLKEIVLALRVERRFTKDHILWLYLNQIYLGDGAYGVGAAADVYFGKSVASLTLAEASLLAGLPQAPTRYSPTRHPERAKRRQLYVLGRMEREGFITGEQRERAASAPIAITPDRRTLPRAAPEYVEHVRRALEKRYGDRLPYRQGLRIFTAVDLRLQVAAEGAVRRGLEDLDRRRGYRGPWRPALGAGAEPVPARRSEDFDGVFAQVMHAAADHAVVRIGTETTRLAASGMKWAGPPSRLRPGDWIRVRPGEKREDVALHQEPIVEGALLAMETATGYVRAMVGGYDFRRSQFNRAVQASRQPGSAFKPLVYAAALDRGYTPASVVNDAPIVVADSSRLWKPENYDRRFHGETRLRDALTFSRNVVSVKIAADVGLDHILAYLPRFGLSRPFPANLSLALGSSETTLLELVRAYGVFAAGGRLCEPIFILKITDRNGDVLEESRPACAQTLSPETAYLMTSMLEDVVERGTARSARALGRPVAGKTGTTNDLMDAWFVGYTPELVAGAWVGFDEKRSLGEKETGGRAALPVWLDFMRAATKSAAKTPFASPGGIVVVRIDEKTGLRATAGGEALPESFRSGTEPVRYAQPAPERGPGDFFRGDF